MKPIHALTFAGLWLFVSPAVVSCTASSPEEDDADDMSVEEGPTAQPAKWTDPEFIEGSGVTNCNMARATSDGWARCRAKVERLNVGERDPDISYVLKDVHVFNLNVERSTSWTGARSCKYRANYQCNIRKAVLTE